MTLVQPSVHSSPSLRPPAQEASRIRSLDGLRGLAILLVLGFHAFARWAEYIPWASVHGDWIVFKYGYLGVHLFFLISGFVIYLTLDKCAGWGDFMLRRWLRLFPSMLIATVLIVSTAFLLHERPSGIPRLIDTLPGLLFIEPILLNKIFGTQIELIEGAFWSLLVEVKFYVIFGAMYFFSKSKGIYALIALFFVSFLYHTVTHLFPEAGIKIVGTIITHVLTLQHFGWFAIGALLYKKYSENKNKYLYMALAILPLAILETGWTDIGVAISCMVIFIIFATTLFVDHVAKIFSSRFFIFFGAISYPLYLIHENAMVALAIKTHQYFDFIPDMLTPIPGLVLIIFVAWVIERYIEPFVKRRIKLALMQIRPTLFN